jgi:hypothetical protein
MFHGDDNNNNQEINGELEIIECLKRELSLNSVKEFRSNFSLSIDYYRPIFDLIATNSCTHLTVVDFSNSIDSFHGMYSSFDHQCIIYLFFYLLLLLD